MIPELNDDLTSDFESEELPSKTYYIDMDKKRIVGTIDGIQALVQQIYLILNTERYDQVIYSWGYGVEFMDLIGRELEFVVPEIERRVTEALIQDNRITGTENFEYDTTIKGRLLVTFTVTSIYGEAQITQEVNI